MALAVALFAWSAAGSAGAANIYKCKDAAGNVTFADAPCPTGANTVDHKVTNDANTLGNKSSSSRTRAKDGKDGKDTSAGKATGSLAAPAAASTGGDGGCDSQRKRYARMQSESCIKAIRVPIGTIECMSPAQRREYLENFKSTLDAVCS